MPENETTENLNNKIKELEKEVAKLRSGIKKKKFGLVWMDVPEKFDEEMENAMPVLKEVPEKAILNNDGKPTHILIEGDNYHALTCLNYTHRGKVDVIYIDPPYNTGARDWKYNNNYVDENDPWRHSKWVNFMNNRVKMTKNLLANNGVICVMVDGYEIHNLRHLMEEIFTDREIVITIIEHNFRGRAKNNFALTHEYAIWGIPRGKEVITRLKEHSGDIKRNLRRTGQGSRRRESPTMFFGIEVHKESLEILSVTDPISEGETLPKTNDDRTEFVFPIDTNGVERRWYYGVDTTKDGVKDGSIWAKRISGRIEIHYFKPGKLKRRKSVWSGPKYDGSTYGSELLTEIIGENDFPFPKSLYAVMECIEAASAKKDAIVLDFFAGSGTTAHAVMEINKQDDGKRQCIICTNNEGNICNEITYPRTSKIINGYDFEGKQKELLYEKKLNLTALKHVAEIFEEIDAIKTFEGSKYDEYEIKIEDNRIKLIGNKEIVDKKEGLGGSLKYYKTDFIGDHNVINVEDKDKVELAHQAGDLLAIAENTLYKVEENEWWQVYENEEKYTAVYFREELDNFERYVDKVKGLEYPVTVYVFSWGDDEFKNEFDHIEDVKVKTIPLPILEIYKSIYNMG